MLSLILLIFALVLFAIAGLVGPPVEPWRHRLVCLGLACWVAAEIMQRAGPLLGHA